MFYFIYQFIQDNKKQEKDKEIIMDIDDLIEAMITNKNESQQIVQVLMFKNQNICENLGEYFFEEQNKFITQQTIDYGQDVQKDVRDKEIQNQDNVVQQELNQQGFDNLTIGGKKWKRKNNQNACKKINSYTFKCLQALDSSRKIATLRKVIHRYDIFVVVLLIIKHLGKLKQFSQLYVLDSNKPLKLHKKLIKDLLDQDVQNFYEKTKKSLNKFIQGDIQEAVSALYDIDNLKCKVYITQSKNRLITLFNQTLNELQQNYIQKRSKKNLIK